MIGLWQDVGSIAVLREVFRGRIWTARPTVVVEDTAARTVLYLPHGMQWKCPVYPDGSWQRVPSLSWTLGDRVWVPKQALLFAWPGVAHGVFMFWNQDFSQFLGWYINMQRPLTSTSLGFDFMDEVLDVEVGPDYFLKWKDENELGRAVELGLWTEKQAREIRAEARRAMEKVPGRREPFGDTWLNWKPDESWPMPTLPDGWDDLSR